LEHEGYKVIRANYQGDVGMHVAKTIWGVMNLKELGLEMPKENQGKWLGVVYAKASEASENEEIKKEINEINKKLYAGDKKLVELWKKTRQWSIDYFEKEVYPDFDVTFDRFYFESEVEKKGVEMAKKLLKENIAKMSEGAIIIDFKKENLGVFLILKSDQTPLYSTKDLYLAELQHQEYNPDKILHIVGSEQNLYFKQLIKTIQLFNPKLAQKEKHISYELVNLPTGKMKSREGKVILYDDTRDKIKELVKAEILKRNKNIQKKELDFRVRNITLGAIKYALLSQAATKTIIFNEEEITNFEGETGPYLQYSYARASSILRKAKLKPKLQIPKELSLFEIALIKKIADFPEELKKAAEKCDPSFIAHYAYHLSQVFNEFYHATKVIGSKEEQFRLKLVEAFRTTLKNALALLGIEVMEEM
jgi:arginyl-tRNA synthetase